MNVIDKKHYLIYQTTNLVNGKIYIGKHITTNIEDNYFGSGNLIRAAINKYGIENFIFKILIELQNEEELNLLEKCVINEDFIKREDVYNICIGGNGGNIADVNHQYTSKQKSIDQKKYYASLSYEEKQHRNKLRNDGILKFKQNPSKYKSYIQHISSTNSKKHGKDTNSFETIWLSNPVLNKNKRVAKTNTKLISQLLSNGWTLGRLKFNYKSKKSKQNSLKNLDPQCAKNTMWINNGKIEKHIIKTESIPDGWNKGRIFHKKIV